MRDFKRLQQDPPAGIGAVPQDNNIMLWNAVIFGYDNDLLETPVLVEFYYSFCAWNSRIINYFLSFHRPDF